jgi:hypothetical protein
LSILRSLLRTKTSARTRAPRSKTSSNACLGRARRRARCSRRAAVAPCRPASMRMPRLRACICRELCV